MKGIKALKIKRTVNKRKTKYIIIIKIAYYFSNFK